MVFLMTKKVPKLFKVLSKAVAQVLSWRIFRSANIVSCSDFASLCWSVARIMRFFYSLKESHVLTAGNAWSFWYMPN